MKNKIIVRIACMTLLVAVLGSLFAGCGSKKESSAQSTVKAEDSTKKTLNKDEPGYKLDTSPVTLDWYIHDGWVGFPKWGVNEANKQMTEKTGVSVNWIINSAGGNDKINVLIASNSLPDILTMGYWEDPVAKLEKGGLVHPLNKLADQYDPYFYKAAKKGILDWYRRDDGNVYGYTNLAYTPQDYEGKSGSKLFSNWAFVVRKDMYEAIGKPDMQTPDGFINALKAAKEKYPKVNNEHLITFSAMPFGQTGSDTFNNILPGFLNIPYEKDGKVYDRTLDTEYVRWLKTLRKANEMELINMDIFTYKDHKPEFKKGRVFSGLVQWSDIKTESMELYKVDPNTTYIAIPGPANEKKDFPLMRSEGPAGWTLGMITTNCKKPDRAIRFFSYLISEEGQKDEMLGKKGVTYETIDGKDQVLPEIMKLKESNYDNYRNRYGMGTLEYAFFADNTIRMPWFPALGPVEEQFQAFSRGKVKFATQYQDLLPKPNEELGVEAQKVTTEWGKILPKLILAKTEADFDSIWKTYLDTRTKLKYDKILEAETNKKNAIKKKLNLN